MTKSKDNYFPQLTGIRAIAAYLVFFFHYNPFNDGFLSNCLVQFNIGVAVFFVLSGFLITYRYSDNFEFSSDWFSQYVLNRVARIYPIYFLLTICTFIFVHYIPRTVPIFILNITFLRGFFDLYKLTGIPQGWTLTVEECFYFLAPLIFLVSKRIKLFIQPVCIVLIGVLLVSIFEKHYIYGFFDSYDFMFIFTFFGRCFEFYVGIKLALLIKMKKQSGQSINYTLIGMAGILSYIICLAILKSQYNLEDSLTHPWRVFTNNFVLPPLIGILFFGLITEKTALRWILGTKIFELLGKSSYIFYLIHVGFITDFIKRVIPVNTTWGLIAFFICVNICSIILFKYVESPLNKLIRGLSRKNRRWAFQSA